MAKTLIDVDEKALARVQEILGTTTKKETINKALQEVIALDARRRDLDRMCSGSLATLADPEERARAWQG